MTGRQTAIAVVASLLGLVGGPTAAAGTEATPVTVPPVPGEVVDHFDPPEHEYGAGLRGARLRATAHEPVRAAREGQVAFAGPVAETVWVSIDHGGDLRTSYGPVEPEVAVGERVAAGDVIGRVGEDADGTLHWGARVDGAYIDPLTLLETWRPTLVPRHGRP